MIKASIIYLLAIFLNLAIVGEMFAMHYVSILIHGLVVGAQVITSLAITVVYLAYLKYELPKHK